MIAIIRSTAIKLLFKPDKMQKSTLFPYCLCIFCLCDWQTHTEQKAASHELNFLSWTDKSTQKY